MTSQSERDVLPQRLSEDASSFQRDCSNVDVSESNLLIIGIGASAGGLDALEKLFEAMPTDTGCAFIVVQHLAPQYPTHMDGILQRRTAMPVTIAADGERLRPNTIVVGPPGQVVEVKDDHVTLRDSDRTTVPISTISALFRSMARFHGPNAIAIVLSGSGSDGSDALTEIRRSGGHIIVQDSHTAEFDGMPKAALATGLFDYTLPPDQIPTAVHSIATKRSIEYETAALSPDADQQLQTILDLLEDAYHVDFARYKQSTIIRRIQRRLDLDQSLSLSDYVERLKSDENELDLLYRDMLIGVTQFFRDVRQFEILEEKVLPDLVEAAASKEEIRVWITACASGEEAYSIAILLDEQLSKLPKSPALRIFATDLHPGALKSATRGVYTKEAISTLSTERLRRYFVRDGEDFQVAPWIRQSILFSTHNLLRDAPFTQIDLVTCRNLLIYFDRETQDNVVARLHFSLRQGGVMFLGNGERIGRHEEEFEAIAPDARMYRKKRDVRLIRITETKLPGVTFEPRRPSIARKPPSAAMLKAYEILLRRLSYNGFLITEAGQIEHTFGNAGRLLQMSGMAQLNLFELVPNDLRAAVQTTLLRAKSTNASQISGTVSVQFPGEDVQRLRVQVEPMPEWSPGVGLFLVRLTGNFADKVTSQQDDLLLSDDERSENTWLRDELEIAQDGLERLMGELGARNEELQASNEELTASNEELQSTNEELQSVNEELHTVNNEHERTISELQNLTHDMETTLTGIDVGVVFLDKDSVIRSLTEKAKRFFDLTDADIDRPIDDFGSRFGISELSALIKQTSFDSKFEDRVTRNRAGEEFLMRIVPKKGMPNGLVGYLLTFKHHSAATDS